MAVRQVVSGGQTGVDRAALDAAIQCGVRYGGWCPADGAAEDLEDPPGLLAAYPSLRPTPSADPRQRTGWNVRDSDATVVLGAVDRSPGTALTVELAVRLERPHLVAAVAAVDDVRRWLAAVEPSVLNVAGPRESEEPGVYAAAYRTMCALLDYRGRTRA